MPWLHVYLIPPAILLSIAYRYTIIRKSHVARRGMVRWQYLIPAGLSVCSIILLGLYHRSTFGSVSGPFSGDYFTFRPRQIGMLFFGLHLDQAHARFIHQPILLLRLIRIPRLSKSEP